MPISQTVNTGIVLVVLQTQNLLDMLDFLIFYNLVVTSFANVEKFTSERENAIFIASDNCKAGNSESFGRISFRQNESAVLGVPAASIVRIFKLYNTRNSECCKLVNIGTYIRSIDVPRSFGTVCLFEYLVLFEPGPIQDIVDDTSFGNCEQTS